MIFMMINACMIIDENLLAGLVYTTTGNFKTVVINRNITNGKNK